MSEAPVPEARAGGGRRWLVALLPLIVFLGLAAVFALQLYSGKDTSTIPSALIGKKAPDLALTGLPGAFFGGQPAAALTNQAVAGKLTLVNVWASWCIPCRQEHPLIMGLARDGRINVVGINYKDKPDNALEFLGELGNPFRAIGVDSDGSAVIDWGVYGVPESFLVSPDGVIVYKHVGPFDENSIRNELMPVVEKALDKSRS